MRQPFRGCREVSCAFASSCRARAPCSRPCPRHRPSQSWVFCCVLPAHKRPFHHPCSASLCSAERALPPRQRCTLCIAERLATGSLGAPNGGGGWSNPHSSSPSTGALAVLLCGPEGRCPNGPAERTLRLGRRVALPSRPCLAVRRCPIVSRARGPPAANTVQPPRARSHQVHLTVRFPASCGTASALRQMI